jgi:hypothetical protein
MNEEELLTLPPSIFEHIDVKAATVLAARIVGSCRKPARPLTDAGNREVKLLLFELYWWGALVRSVQEVHKSSRKGVIAYRG